MNTSLPTIISKSLPALSGASLTYNVEKNIYLTLGYTSNAGNTYYKVIRFSDRLAVFYHLGEGYAYTFLNGISMFCWDGDKAKLIAQKFWGGCDWQCFSEQFAKEQSVIMLKEYLSGQAKMLGTNICEKQLNLISKEMIEQMHQKQIA